MSMDLNSILLYLVLIVLVYFVIKKLPVIIVAVLGFGLLSVMSLFILRDMLHVPVNHYVDTTEIDQFMERSSDYTNEKILGKDDEVVGGVDKDVVGDDGDTIKLGRIEKYKYDEMNEAVIEGIVDRYYNIVEDTSFENKLRGMTPYVDISYEFSNMKMYSSDDREYLIIELIK